MTNKPDNKAGSEDSKPKAQVKPAKQEGGEATAAPSKAKQEAPRKRKDAEAASAPVAGADAVGGVLEAPAKPKVIKAKGSKNVVSGIAHILATFNNTVVTITDHSGNVIAWSSAGRVGFKGSRKSTAYAAQLVAQDAARQGMGHGLREVEIRLKGPGSGREAAVRTLHAMGLEILAIKDVTPIPHNGCRPKKRRRV